MNLSNLSFATLFAISLGVLVQAQPNAPTYKVCDGNTEERTLNKAGLSGLWKQPDDKIMYTAQAPKGGACGEPYSDNSHIVCLAPGWVNNGKTNGCNKWVTILSKETGASTYARVADSCGAEVGSTFECNDMFLSKRVFEQLAGNKKAEAVAAGHLSGEIVWSFTAEPCWACNAGLPGKLPNGQQDTCHGQDNMGYTRCGRKQGDARIIGPGVSFICNQQVDTCDKVNSIVPKIPKIATPHLRGLSTPEDLRVKKRNY